MCAGYATVLPHNTTKTIAREVVSLLLRRVEGCATIRPHNDTAAIAYEVVSLVLRRVCQKESDVAELTSDAEFEVRWKISGEFACSVPATSNMVATEVKCHIYEQLQIPIEEQRLFVGARELVGDAALERDSAALMLVRSSSDPRITNLGHFRVPAAFDPLPSGAFTKIRQVARGINGDVFSYRWSHDDGGSQMVAMKRLRMSELDWNVGKETDERIVHFKPWQNAPRFEDALTEIGVMMYLTKQPDMPVYLLKMLGVFSDNNFACLVSEFAEGGELFALAAAGPVAEHEAQRYMLQISQAVDFLHQHRIAHRDLSLENVLLKNGEVRVMDFGVAVRSHSASGVPLRYFAAVGKDNYRAPECYVPKQEKLVVVAPESSFPGDVTMVKVGTSHCCEVRLPEDAVPGRPCVAEPWGYAAPQADVFALGICFFIMAFSCPAWHQARFTDPYFFHVYNKGDQGLESLLTQWRKPLLSSEAMQLLSSMLRPQPRLRPAMRDVVNSAWLSTAGGVSPCVAAMGGA